jgi:hypothetical protein
MNSNTTFAENNGKLDPVAYAKIYKEAGLFPTYYERGEKKPERGGWPNEKWTLEEIPGKFKDKNIGIILGPSGLVCVDADVPEAQRVAETVLKHILGTDTLVGGRPGNPRSHFIYRVAGELDHTSIDGPTGEVDGRKKYKTERFVEILAGNHQVAVAPSIHPDGDTYDWAGDEFDPAKIATVNATDLLRAVRIIAVGAMIARAMPDGGKHDYAMALAGLMLRGERVPEADINLAFQIGWGSIQYDYSNYRGAREEAKRDYERCIRDTKKNLKNKVACTGGPTVNGYLPGLAPSILKAYGHTGEGWAADESRVPQGETLMGIVDSSAELFHTAGKEAYATISVTVGEETHEETIKVSSSAFTEWLVGNFYKITSKTPSTNALTDTRRVISARAVYDGPELPVWRRTARGEDEAIYIDLGTPDWSAARVTAEGWEIIPSAEVPVKFARGKYMGALPTPDSSAANIHDLRFMLNVDGEEGFALNVAWLIQALKPEGPYPLLVTEGEQGSAKSSNSRILLALVDASTEEDPLRTHPKEERDLLVAARNNWCLGYDNLSWLSEGLSDAFCRLSTGGAFGARTLFENEEETLLSAKRPVLMNSIVGIINRPDLQERSIVVRAPVIDEARRKKEAEINQLFEEAAPGIFAAILDGLVVSMSAPEPADKGGPRMIDFVQWVTPAIEAYDLGNFGDMYRAMRSESDAVALSGDPVAGALVLYMQDADEVVLPPSELLSELIKELKLSDYLVLDKKRWPPNAAAFGRWMGRSAKVLRSFGLELSEERSRENGRRKVVRWANGIEEADKRAALAAADFPFVLCDDGTKLRELYLES